MKPHLLAATAVAMMTALLPPPLTYAADDAGRAKAADSEKKDGEKGAEAKDDTKSKDGSITIGGQSIAYTATASTLVLKKADGSPRAKVFSIAYTKKDPGELTQRPVMFCFNGGPGSSSVWLHMGAFGPQRVALSGDGTAPPKPPYELTANQYSLLDSTDLVFIDPVSTGYSRAEKGEDPHQFHGFQQDIESVGDFIRRWVTKHQRWGSPKYLGGESYGGLRCAGLAGHLQERYGMYLNGLVIVSGVIDFSTLSASGSNDLPYITFLPALTATAHYHKQLNAELQSDLKAAVAAAERYALGPYAALLLKGVEATTEEMSQAAQALSRLTGLPAEKWLRARLRISSSEFQSLLLEKDIKRVGRFDGRAIVELGVANDRVSDPSYTNVYGAYATSLNRYIRTDLGYESDLPYEILTGAVQPWDYGSFTNRYVTAADALGSALLANPHLRLFIACGWYDMATPPLNIRHTLNHLNVPAQRLKDAVTYGYYEGGHMMYTNESALKALNADIHQFLSQ